MQNWSVLALSIMIGTGTHSEVENNMYGEVSLKAEVTAIKAATRPNFRDSILVVMNCD
jgi:hypothetical protein